MNLWTSLISEFEKEKELTDRALKLPEVAKPKSNWELQGVLGLAAFVLGIPGREAGGSQIQTYPGEFRWPLTLKLFF